MPRCEVPPVQRWRLQYLRKLLLARLEMEARCEDVEDINELIDSLASS